MLTQTQIDATDRFVVAKKEVDDLRKKLTEAERELDRARTSLNRHIPELGYGVGRSNSDSDELG
jgi:hypothetical protein